MCTKIFHGLVKSKGLLISIFVTVIISYGYCQNADPRGTYRSSRTNLPVGPGDFFNFAFLDQQFGSIRRDEPEKIDKSFKEDLKEANSSSSESQKPEEKAREVAKIHDTQFDERNIGESSKVEPQQEQMLKKTGNFFAFSNRCNSARNAKKRLCGRDSSLKKRRRNSNLAHGSSDSDVQSNNQTRSLISDRKSQNNEKPRKKNRSWKRGRERARKQKHIDKMKSRKNNLDKISVEATSKQIRERVVKAEELVPKAISSLTKTTYLQEKLVRSDPKIMGTSESDQKMMKYLDSDNTIVPSVRFNPDDREEHVVQRINDTSKIPVNSGRKTYKENVEHEFSRNLEKEILWSRTRLPEILNETVIEKMDEANSTPSATLREAERQDLTSSYEVMKNAKFDAAKMLGYARTPEDLPIMDLENDVLARTIQDYNTYLKSSRRTSPIDSEAIDFGDRSNYKVESVIPIRRPAYGEKSNYRRKLEEDGEDEPETIGEVSTETGTNLQGDLTCIHGIFIPAPLARHALIKYVKSSVPGHEYLEADYECMPGFRMATLNRRLLCKNRRWLGELPSCKTRRGQSGACVESSCDQVCNEVDGQAKCSCFKGFRLDGHECHDIDECDGENSGCEYKCVNTPGSYRCECPKGMKLSETKFTCIDLNECTVDNGGCSEVCENTDGSFFCACDGDEKALSADGKSCTDINNLACPSLDLAGRGYLMCSRGTTPRTWHDGSREDNRPGTKCYLKCPVGYQLHGEYELTCQGDGIWDGPKHGECVKHSKPRLECPKEVVAEVPPDRDEAFVTFDQPSTDLDWFRYVRSKPSWGTRLEASLKPGLHIVTFFVKHPISKRQATCALQIVVKEGEAPKVNNCPSDISGKNGTIFTWTEPTFTDNVGVIHTSNNESPGKGFGPGTWKVVYEASDEAGWTTRCAFSVVVHQD